MKLFRHIHVTVLLMLALALIIALPLAAEAGSMYNDFEYTINDSTKEITIAKYHGSEASVVIPAKINGYNVTSIRENAFKNDGALTSVSFESGSILKGIGARAFENCVNLQSITFPSTLKNIGAFAFCKCSKLLSVSLPEGMTELGTDLRIGIFAGCTSLSSVTLPSTLLKIGWIFDKCSSLKTVDLPAGLTTMSRTFDGSGITQIDIPKGVTVISGRCFYNCTALTTVKMSANVKVIDGCAFENCSSLTSINIPADLTSLGNACFRGCTSLTKLRFTDATDYISTNVFANCPALTVELVRGTKLESYCINSGVPYVAYATSLGGCTIEGIEDVTYNGKKQIMPLKITWGSEELVQDTDYTVAYSGNLHAGTATVTITGIGDYLGTVVKNFKILPADINDCKITLSDKSLVYNTKYRQPKVTVKLNGITVKKSEYKVSYTDNRYVGEATVTVSGTKDFINSKVLHFSIVPKGASIKKLTAGSKSLTVTWKPNKQQTTGYQIQYSLKSNFKNAKTKTVTPNTEKALKITKLSGGKTYYVRIRTYTLIGEKKYYSEWSDKVKVKVKK